MEHGDLFGYSDSRSKQLLEVIPGALYLDVTVHGNVNIALVNPAIRDDMGADHNIVVWTTLDGFSSRKKSSDKRAQVRALRDALTYVLKEADAEDPT